MQHELKQQELKQQELRPILQKLAELRLSPQSQPGIKMLYVQMQAYIQTGVEQTIQIPLPGLNVRIVGVLRPGASVVKITALPVNVESTG